MSSHAVGVLGRDDAALEQLHGAGDGGAHRDGVHAVLVAEEVGLGDGVEVVDAAVGAERPGGLVLGALAVARVVGIVDLGHPAAADDAAEAALGPHELLGGQRLAADLVGGREVAVLEVARGQRAGLVEDVDQHVGAVGLEAGAADRVRLDHLARLHHGGLEALRVGDLDGAAAEHRDGLEVLGAHHGADAGAAGRPVHLVHDVGDEREMLAGRTDAGDLGVLVGLGAHEVGGVGRVVPHMAAASRISTSSSLIHR